MTVISARDSNLQHEEQSQSINWRQKPSELHGFRPVGELQYNICFLYLENQRDMDNCEVFGQYDGGRVLFHTRVVSEQQLVQSTYHKFFPLVASTEVVAIISAISLKYQRRQCTEAKWKKLITQEKRRKLAALPEMRVALA